MVSKLLPFRALIGSLAVAVVASIATPATASPASTSIAALGTACAAPITIDNLYVETKWKKNTYRTGDVAKAVVTVYRPGDDPASVGQPVPPPERTAAPDVEVSVTLRLGYPYPEPYDLGMTGADGKFVAKIKIPKRAHDDIRTTTIATKRHNENPYNDCIEVDEIGYETLDPGFAVK